ncbi:hypothetical protein [Chryseobacterium sp. Leaf405]|uniref:hypothetical protein n=1 Tax=Chryseobacterium sp. Leaf405 TaxID=1736367 RepID=UPI000A46F879|nr:hypothetical protein [Chryseobacterium sp. Leaf405]
MIEDHSPCIKVSETGICNCCYSKNIIKNGTTKQGNSNISVRIVTEDLSTFIHIKLTEKISICKLFD